RRHHARLPEGEVHTDAAEVERPGAPAHHRAGRGLGQARAEDVRGRGHPRRQAAGGPLRRRAGRGAVLNGGRGRAGDGRARGPEGRGGGGRPTGAWGGGGGRTTGGGHRAGGGPIGGGAACDRWGVSPAPTSRTTPT